MSDAERRTARETLQALWWAGVDAVRGDTAVAHSLTAAPIGRPDHIIAVGKAAASMCSAAQAAFGPDVPSLVVTKYGHAHGIKLAPGTEIIESAHPVPDAESLRAGQRLIDCVAAMPPDSRLLFLVSGGASALAEAPAGGMGLGELAAANRRLLSEGLDIAAMNTERRKISRIKGGRLLERFPGADVTMLAMSDVEGDDIMVIGSGIGAIPDTAVFAHDSRIIASNAIARAAVRDAARSQGLIVRTNAETLYGDVKAVASDLAGTLRSADDGIHIFGGETTVILPPDPGRGGRNQALALELAERISGEPGIDVLVAGTDGTDGPTEDAGSFADGRLWSPDARPALDRADSGSYLDRQGALFRSGPTGTNVMDLAIALVRRG